MVYGIRLIDIIYRHEIRDDQIGFMNKMTDVEILNMHKEIEDYLTSNNYIKGSAEYISAMNEMIDDREAIYDACIEVFRKR